MKFIKPDYYKNILDLPRTQMAIKLLKDNFENYLSKDLHLTRVSAPLFVERSSGLNDNLTGVESPVKFVAEHIEEGLEIVHSLAKWKRAALKQYGMAVSEGIYADMNAIRKNEELSNMHSIYVDQWDWELVISEKDRNIEFLENIVTKIYNVFLKTEELVLSRFPELERQLPENLTIVSTQELEDMYPNLSSSEREYEITKEKKAIFLTGVGKALKSGKKHENRAPDYDDWNLNGDFIFWSRVLNCPIELSSMGIRVNSEVMLSQLEEASAKDRLKYTYHKQLIEGELPQTVGGGIGQSRLCMFFLQKAHIGEVQVSSWSSDMKKACSESGITLL